LQVASLVCCAYCGILGYKFFGFPLNPKVKVDRRELTVYISSQIAHFHNFICSLDRRSSCNFRKISFFGLHLVHLFLSIRYINSVDAYSVECAPKEPSKASMKLGMLFCLWRAGLSCWSWGRFCYSFPASNLDFWHRMPRLIARIAIIVLIMFLISALNASTILKFLESTRKFTGFVHAVIVWIYWASKLQLISVQGYCYTCSHIIFLDYFSND
jgi:hypothetical protein